MAQNPSGGWKIAIAGGSLGGLCAGVALNRARSRRPGLRTRSRAYGKPGVPASWYSVSCSNCSARGGAGALPITSCEIRRYLNPRPAARVRFNPRLKTLRPGSNLQHLTAQPSRRIDTIWARRCFNRSRTLAGDLSSRYRVMKPSMSIYWSVPMAHQSASRRRLLPGVQSKYAGYVAWRGVLDEADARPDVKRFF